MNDDDVGAAARGLLGLILDGILHERCYYIYTVRNGRPSLSQKRVHREKRFQSEFAQSMPRRGATPLAAAARLPLQICSPAASTQSVEAAGLKITSRNRSTAVDLVPGVALQLRDGRLARSGVYV